MRTRPEPTDPRKQRPVKLGHIVHLLKVKPPVHSSIQMFQHVTQTHLSSTKQSTSSSSSLHLHQWRQEEDEEDEEKPVSSELSNRLKTWTPADLSYVQNQRQDRHTFQ
ncbi:unnamed protein product [Pleuronectes platessa]|uniref:Uncharacterized protein n=1 Tax=Pleuronectes platessa TaxID=8262 RepID=A0A9N7YFJ9_PLEPL|nr:unnamed protein product [Pleuronectes platessa]